MDMDSPEIGVLIVDDSALMRNLIAKIVEGIPGLVVAGRAMNGQFALDKIPVCKPDVIVLDMEMPGMDGIEFLKERKRRGIEIPVIMLSSQENTNITMQCLELGASDFLTKPGGPVGGDLSVVAARLAELLPSYGAQYARSHENKCVPMFRIPMDNAASARQGLASAYGDLNSPIPPSPEPQKTPALITPLREYGKIEVIAIGISTGGPNALREVFKNIDPNLKQPILVVQHMPAGFTEEFANSLNNICPLTVKEAHDGDVLKSGRVLIAPGNYHIYVQKKALAHVVRLSDAPQRNGHRPSADVLFESVASVFQNRALGVIMTGMGNDGAAELAEMRRQGAHTLGQDENTCIVYGMPKVAWEMGGVQRQVPLQEMAKTISALARDFG